MRRHASADGIAEQSVPGPAFPPRGTLLQQVADERSEQRLARLMADVRGMSFNPPSGSGAIPGASAAAAAGIMGEEAPEEAPEGCSADSDDDGNDRRTDAAAAKAGKARGRRKASAAAPAAGSHHRRRYCMTPLAAVVTDVQRRRPASSSSPSRTAAPWLMWTASRAVAQYSASVQRPAKDSKRGKKPGPRPPTAGADAERQRRRPTHSAAAPGGRSQLATRGASAAPVDPQAASGTPPRGGSHLNPRIAARLQHIYK